MRSSPTRPVDGVRVAVVGAESPNGVQIRNALSDLGIAGERVALFGDTSGQAVLSEYGGEARLIQEPVASEVVAHDVVMLCEPCDSIEAILSARGPDILVVDAAGCLPPGAADVVHMGINPPDSATAPAVVAIPHGISAVLSEVLRPIDESVGVRRASAVIMRPVADFGKAAIEELRDQTLGVFNFGEIPREIFGQQLSFNLLPDRLLDRAGPALDERIACEVEEILGWSEPRLAVRLVNVPVFHGHAAFLSVESDDRGDLDAVRRALDATSGLDRTKEQGVGTPLEVASERRTVIAEISEDRTGGYWIWLVAGEVGAVSADLALRVARTLRDL